MLYNDARNSEPSRARQGRECSLRTAWRRSQRCAVSDDETDESLAKSVSALDISSEYQPCSAASSSMSPTGESSTGRHLGGSNIKRRSIAEMSPSDRMTPRSLEHRGLGLPWMRTSGICTLEMETDEVANRARQFCLVPTPELGGENKRTISPPSSPENQSPSAMQKRFVDRVHRASLGQPSPYRMSSSSSSSVAPDSSQLDVESMPAAVSPIAAFLECSSARECRCNADPCARYLGAGHVDKASGRTISPNSFTVVQLASSTLAGSLATPDDNRCLPRTHVAAKVIRPHAHKLVGAHRSISVKENTPPEAESRELGGKSVASLVQRFEQPSDIGTALIQTTAVTSAQPRRSMSRSPPQSYQRSKRLRP